MSLLATIAQQAAGGLIDRVLGRNNRALVGDCLDVSDVGSYAAKLAMYPQCAPYISASGPVTAMPGAGTFVQPYTGMPTVPSASVVPIAYQSPMLTQTMGGMMGVIPKIGPMLQQLPKVM
jgi:hypothetical protein